MTTCREGGAEGLVALHTTSACRADAISACEKGYVARRLVEWRRLEAGGRQVHTGPGVPEAIPDRCRAMELRRRFKHQEGRKSARKCWKKESRKNSVAYCFVACISFLSLSLDPLFRSSYCRVGVSGSSNGEVAFNSSSSEAVCSHRTDISRPAAAHYWRGRSGTVKDCFCAQPRLPYDGPARRTARASLGIEAVSISKAARSKQKGGERGEGRWEKR